LSCKNLGGVTIPTESDIFHVFDTFLALVRPERRDVIGHARQRPSAHLFGRHKAAAWIRRDLARASPTCCANSSRGSFSRHSSRTPTCQGCVRGSRRRLRRAVAAPWSRPRPATRTGASRPGRPAGGPPAAPAGGGGPGGATGS